MISLTRIFGLCLFLCLSGLSMAECSKSVPAPSLPDGGSASTEELVAAQKLVKTYMTDVNAYLACVEAEINALTDSDDAETRAKLELDYNVVFDEMNGVAEGFNAAVRAYKAANS